MSLLRFWQSVCTIGVSAALIIGGGVGPAHAFTDEQELEIAKFILAFACQDDGKAERSRAWYTEYTKIQDEAPYTTSGNIKLFSTAVHMVDGGRLDHQVYFGVYDNDNSVFNPRTRQKVCEDQDYFAKAMKRVVVDNKGVVKSCCATEDGMADFFTRKLQNNVDLSLRESPEDVERIIAELAKAAAEEDAGRKYAEMDADDKADADEFAKDYAENFRSWVGLTPEKIAEAKQSQPEKYQDKWACNADSNGECQSY
ncbi:hypothetical protein [Nocardia brasiliensis]|uniref:hypothetical protein n=1 Tax=Nocardia brasiliensis TaxID=37326 RepID=UPI001895BF2D|nr:hypothetical protein [Nocardia brasiliensis]MBF6126989.1 hypothetical protein [Nocardia brasiliensis]